MIAATARWLLRSFPPDRGAFSAALAEVQTRQATTVAAWLRYPTEVDAALVALVGPGGSQRLDWIAGTVGGGPNADDDHEPGAANADAWRTWVDEVVASWAACLLSDPSLAKAAVTAAAATEHAARQPAAFRRLLAPDEHDHRAAALLRHPDLVEPIADLHRADLVKLTDTVGAP